MFKMKMGTMLSIRTVAVFVFLLFIVGLCFSNANDVFADDMYVYPQKGQSNKQMEKDKYECYGWAKKKTGFDPMAAPTATAPQRATASLPRGGGTRLAQPRAGLSPGDDSHHGHTGL